LKDSFLSTLIFFPNRTFLLWTNNLHCPRRKVFSAKNRMSVKKYFERVDHITSCTM
jgi:hypothetical protein